jgi:hypothetical protein
MKFATNLLPNLWRFWWGAVWGGQLLFSGFFGDFIKRLDIGLVKRRCFGVIPIRIVQLPTIGGRSTKSNKLPPEIQLLRHVKTACLSE